MFTNSRILARQMMPLKWDRNQEESVVCSCMWIWVIEALKNKICNCEISYIYLCIYLWHQIIKLMFCQMSHTSLHVSHSQYLNISNSQSIISDRYIQVNIEEKNKKVIKYYNFMFTLNLTLLTSYAQHETIKNL